MSNCMNRIKWQVIGITSDRRPIGRQDDLVVELQARPIDGYTFGALGPQEMEMITNELLCKLNNYDTKDEEFAKYCAFDAAMTKAFYDRSNLRNLPAIKKVIFNNPATIVIWADGTKTIVKCQNNETYDPEKGLAMAITKKALGNEGNYFEVIKKWVEKCDVPSEHSSKWLATQRLHNALNDKKATKADLIAAMNEDIGYLSGTDS